MNGKTSNNGTSLSIFIVLLVLASLACTMFQGPPEKPAETIPVTTEAAGDLEEDVEAAAEQASATGQVELRLTEAQVTSYLALKLQEQQDLGISTPQIYLRDGKVQAYAVIEQELGTFALYFEIVPQIMEGGQPRLVITNVFVGDVAAPDALVAQIQQYVDEAYINFTGSAGSKFVAESITIADGIMTIKGKVK